MKPKSKQPAQIRYELPPPLRDDARAQAARMRRASGAATGFVRHLGGIAADSITPAAFAELRREIAIVIHEASSLYANTATMLDALADMSVTNGTAPQLVHRKAADENSSR